MDYVQKKRLLKLADFLEVLPKHKFKFDAVVAGAKMRDWEVPEAPRKSLDCGSVACAIGWCPVVFPRLARYDLGAVPLYRVGLTDRDDRMRYTDVARELFGLTENEADLLFTPSLGTPGTPGLMRPDATPRQVAKRIRVFVAGKTRQRAATGG